MFLVPRILQGCSMQSAWVTVNAYMFLDNGKKSIDSLVEYLYVGFEATRGIKIEPGKLQLENGNESAKIRKSIKKEILRLAKIGMFEVNDENISIPEHLTMSNYSMAYSPILKGQHHPIDETGETVVQGVKQQLRGDAAKRFLKLWNAFGSKNSRKKVVDSWAIFERETLKENGGVFPDKLFEGILHAAEEESFIRSENEELRNAIMNGKARGMMPPSPAYALTWVNQRRWDADIYNEHRQERLKKEVKNESASSELTNWRKG